VAAESSFSTFREIAYDRVGQFFHTGPWLGRTVFRPIVECAFIYAKWRYHLNFDVDSPEKAVESTIVPVLLIHGQLDSNIPVRHSRKIAAGNRHVALWEVPGADHCGAIGVAPSELERRVIDWFQQNDRGSRRQARQHSDVAR
jgi:pimeloyl-ACP methyl ester carboxylesterase